MRVQDNMTIKWEDDGNRYCLHIQQDSMPDDPRSDFEPISVMACWHKKCKLGDDLGNVQPYEFWQELVRKNVPESDVNEAAIAGRFTKSSGIIVKKDKDNPSLYDIHLKDFGTDYKGLQKEVLVYYVLEELSISDCQALLRPYAEWLPLWLYDHSGITMSCGKRTYPYSDQWDSGQVGYIIVLKDKIVSELALDPKDDENWRSKAVSIMESNVETYDQYLTGEVYCFDLYKFVDDGTEDGGWDVIESCSGFYGDNPAENGMLESVGYNLQTAVEKVQFEVGEAHQHVHTYWTFD